MSNTIQLKCYVKHGHKIPELDGKRSGRYGSFFMSIILSYKEGCSNAAIALAIKTAI